MTITARVLLENDALLAAVPTADPNKELRFRFEPSSRAWVIENVKNNVSGATSMPPACFQPTIDVLDALDKALAEYDGPGKPPPASESETPETPAETGPAPAMRAIVIACVKRDIEILDKVLRQVPPDQGARFDAMRSGITKVTQRIAACDDDPDGFMRACGLDDAEPYDYAVEDAQAFYPPLRPK